MNDALHDIDTFQPVLDLVLDNDQTGQADDPNEIDPIVRVYFDLVAEVRSKRETELEVKTTLGLARGRLWNVVPLLVEEGKAVPTANMMTKWAALMDMLRTDTLLGGGS